MRHISKMIYGIIVMALIGVSTLSSCSNKTKIQLETATIVKSDMSESITASGTIEPITSVEVGTQVSGIINKIYVDYNSVVKKGELIAELETDLLESDLNSAKASLAASKTQYEYQSKNYNRVKELHNKDLVSDSDFDEAEYQYLSAKSSYEKNQADLFRQQANYNYAKIYSPIDGVVLSKAVEEGQTVASSFSTPTLFTIAKDLTKMRVIADVDESDIGQVEVGQRVSFYVDAYQDLFFSGQVVQVRMEATTTSNVVTYEVVVNAPNDDLKLKPGMTAYVSIYTLEKDGVLTVSSEALAFTPNVMEMPEGISIVPLQNVKPSDKTVWVKEGNAIKERVITTGVVNRSIHEVTSGLTQGDVVVEGTTFAAVNQESAGEKATGEASPFMPQHPGANKNKK